MLRYQFADVITSEDQLRSILGMPGSRAVAKQLPALDRHSRNFISRSPFAFISSANAAGRCDVSPKGDGPGFVEVLDDPDVLIEIADWESAEARAADMDESGASGAYAPLTEILHPD